MQRNLRAPDNHDECRVMTSIVPDEVVNGEDCPSIDIHIFPPSAMLKRPFYTLATVGMSLRKMPLPPGGTGAPDGMGDGAHCQFPMWDGREVQWRYKAQYPVPYRNEVMYAVQELEALGVHAGDEAVYSDGYAQEDDLQAHALFWRQRAEFVMHLPKSWDAEADEYGLAEALRRAAHYVRDEGAHVGVYHRLPNAFRLDPHPMASMTPAQQEQYRKESLLHYFAAVDCGPMEKVYANHASHYSARTGEVPCPVYGPGMPLVYPPGTAPLDIFLNAYSSAVHDRGFPDLRRAAKRPRTDSSGSASEGASAALTPLQEAVLGQEIVHRCSFLKLVPISAAEAAVIKEGGLGGGHSSDENGVCPRFFVENIDFGRPWVYDHDDNGLAQSEDEDLIPWCIDMKRTCKANVMRWHLQQREAKAAAAAAAAAGSGAQPMEEEQ